MEMGEDAQVPTFDIEQEDCRSAELPSGLHGCALA